MQNRVPPGHCGMRGTLLNVNTHEEFKRTVKEECNQLAQSAAAEVLFDLIPLYLL